MSDVINGVPRELLAKIADYAPGHPWFDKLAALLTAQPQASAAQSAPAGEREAFEAQYTSEAFEGMPGNNRFEREADGSYWYIGTRKAWWGFQAGAAWQRTQSAVLFGGDERQHIICVCPDCLAEAQRTQSAGVREESCDHCEPEGVFATDGAGPFDCYACGKKAGAGEALDIVARAIDGPCRDVETVAEMSELICAELSAARWLRMAPADAIDFKVPITKVLGSFGLSVEDSEAFAAEIAISLIPHLAQWAEDQLAAAPAQPAALAYKDDPRSPSELSLAGCRCVRFGEGNPHWPCKIHPAQPAAQGNAEILEQCANWCANQAASDWYGKTAADMVRKFASSTGQPAAQDQGERYTCIGKGGSYELVGYARLAGELRGMLGGLVPDLAIYRSDTDYFARTRQDFKERMEQIDAASTGQEV